MATKARKTAKRTPRQTKRTARRPAASPPRTLRSEAQAAGTRIREAWADTVAAVTTAQANLEAEVRKLLKRNKVGTKDAATLVRDLRALADRERRKAARELRSRLAVLQARIDKERKTASRTLDDAARSTLAALNIPSRAEIAALTRKVEALSRKVETRKR